MMGSIIGSVCRNDVVSNIYSDYESRSLRNALRAKINTINWKFVYFHVIILGEPNLIRK